MREFSKPTIAAGLRTTFRKMGVGDKLCIRMDEYTDSSVSQSASLAAREIGGKISVHRDWEERRFIVTRKA